MRLGGWGSFFTHAMESQLAVLLVIGLAALHLPGTARGQFDDCGMLQVGELGNTTIPVSTGLLAQALAASGRGATLVQLLQFNTVCLAQGTMRDTYRSLSLIAAFVDGSGVVSILQLHLQCVAGSWSIDNLRSTAVAASIPSTGTLTTPLRTDCFLCANPLQQPMVTEAEHCLACASICVGLSRCYAENLFSLSCCNFFDMTGSCATTCPAGSTPNTEFECVCNAGFGPSTRSRNTCVDINECIAMSPCRNGGTCSNTLGSFTCACDHGFTGSTCESDVDECREGAPCMNGGTCMNTIGSYTCSCEAGFTGSACGMDLNECEDQPCQNGGTCVNEIGSFSCICEAGFTGTTCEIDIDECSEGIVACLNGSTCTNTFGSYSCSCEAGFTGSACGTDLNECEHHPCQNGGTCVNAIGSFSCICEAGSTGLACEIDIDECSEGIVCLNGGTCMNTFGSFGCSCEAGFTGSTCDTDLNECENHPCRNGGTCINTLGSFTCSCDTGFSGTTCETDTIDDCLSMPCVNGTCIDLPGGFICSCAPGFTGTVCATDIDDCLGDPCLSGGACIDLPNAFSCDCALGFTGATCETNINDCTSDSCRNEGTCTDLVNDFSCHCEAGFTGKSCEINADECQSNPCQNGGRCTDLINAYFCQCQVGYTGGRCETSLGFAVCDGGHDDIWYLRWPSTLPESVIFQPCPMANTKGLVSRQCLPGGEWSEVDTTACTRQEFASISRTSALLFSGSSMPDAEAVDELISNLTMITSYETTDNLPQFPSDLNTTNAVVSMVVNFLLQSEEITTINEGVFDVFNNLLETTNECSWEQLQMEDNSLGSTALLQNIENYGKYISRALANQTVDSDNETAITLNRSNIVLEAEVIPRNISKIETVAFPDLEGDKEKEFGNAPTQAHIPASLLIEKGANESEIVAVNVLFSNLEMFLPLASNVTQPVSSVISSQIFSDIKPRNNLSPVEFYFETEKFNKSLFKVENPRCAFVIEDSARKMTGNVWSMDGIEEVSVTPKEDEDQIYYAVVCRSYHLTSFAVLLDVYGITEDIPKPEAFAFSVVTYIGCAISIFFLVASIVLLLTLGKELFTSVVFFIHLNLSIALLLGYLLFITGVDHAVSIKGVCTAVAALLQYLFTAVFCWMLCEGIMLYLMLVLVFSSLAKKWWFFLIIGWGLPAVPVAVSVGIMPESYGSQKNCWLVVEGPSSVAIWLFVGPMLAIILLNAFFWVAALWSLYKARKAKAHEDKQGLLFWKVFLGSIFLLPLLGLTWVFGLLAVNENLTAFAWIFTVFNSFQGLFIFVFHVVRNDKIRKRICGVFKKPVPSSTRATSTPYSNFLRRESTFRQ